MDTNFKMNRLFDALRIVREMTDEMKAFHDSGMTCREVDEELFGTEPGHHRDVSGKLLLANGPFSWLRRFNRKHI